MFYIFQLSIQPIYVTIVLTRHVACIDCWVREAIVRNLRWVTLFLGRALKGQLISKGLFGAFTFSQKTNENKSTSSKDELFRSFFGRKWQHHKTFWNKLTFSNLFLAAFPLLLLFFTFLCLPFVFARSGSSSVRVKTFTICTKEIPIASIISTASSTIPVTRSVIVTVIAIFIISKVWKTARRGSRCYRSSTLRSLYIFRIRNWQV